MTNNEINFYRLLSENIINDKILNFIKLNNLSINEYMDIVNKRISEFTLHTVKHNTVTN